MPTSTREPSHIFMAAAKLMQRPSCSRAISRPFRELGSLIQFLQQTCRLFYDSGSCLRFLSNVLQSTSTHHSQPFLHQKSPIYHFLEDFGPLNKNEQATAFSAFSPQLRMTHRQAGSSLYHSCLAICSGHFWHWQIASMRWARGGARGQALSPSETPS